MATSNGHHCQQLLPTVNSHRHQQWPPAIPTSNACQQWPPAMNTNNDRQLFLPTMAASNGHQQWPPAMAASYWVPAIATMTQQMTTYIDQVTSSEKRL